MRGDVVAAVIVACRGHEQHPLGCGCCHCCLQSRPSHILAAACTSASTWISGADTIHLYGHTQEILDFVILDGCDQPGVYSI